MQSLWTYQAATARLPAIREPDQSVCLSLNFDANGAITDSTSPHFITDKLDARQGPAARALVADQGAAPRHLCFIYPDRRQPWYWYLSPAKQAKFDEAWPGDHRLLPRYHRRFAEDNSANTFPLPGAPHYVYINNEAEVVRWMRKFLGIPPRP